MLASKAFREKYVFQCDQSQRSPLLPVLRSIDDATASGRPLQRLSYDGSEAENRAKRLDDFDALIFAKLLEEDTTIKEVIFSCNHISDEGATHLAQMLKKNSSITHLNLRSNSISEKGAFELAQALLVNTTLKRLNLNGNAIGSGASHFSDVIRENRGLESLDLGNTELRIDALISLCSALASNPTLGHFGMENPRTSSEAEESMRHIGVMVKQNTGLKVLDISKHFIEDSYLEFFMTYMRENKSIRSLILRGNHIAGDGGSLIASLLVSNPQIEEVDLAYNKVGDRGAAALAKVIGNNTSLRKLNLTSNSISGSGLSALANGLKTNKTLYCLKIWGNNFDTASASQFHGLLSRTLNPLIDRDIVTYVVDGTAQVAEAPPR